ncbi:MAG TPA: sigma-70 family RNA polymerase sigma factor [Oscillospiraceae bacterium]|nr:sigma-70 family RNA polymerase sigma factor [Oscillospiraceae bacterium]HNX99645.1 sigma-70 family RNA polymerase sigma factor [Oscillospiraceae bacterium]HPS75026.1 sigma-70 family RNA polymerase sigma factor [Oscillospiraceae bacterium]
MIDSDNFQGIDDSDLLRLAGGGDREAEERLATRYTRLVRICARPLFLAGGDSEDLIQEGMLGLLSAIRQYDPSMSTAFKTYAEVCIRRRLYSAVKSASRLKHLPLNDGLSLDYILSEESQTQLAANPEAFRRTPEEQVLARESEFELNKAFAQKLSRLEKDVLALYLDGLSYDEIAAKTGRDVKSVDNAVQRIRRKLARDPNLGDIS